MAKVLITGATGFLGSNIAEFLLDQGHDIIATYRSTSSRKLCGNFENNIYWVNQDNKSWEDEIIDLKPEVVIHSAWLGVTHQDRDNWESQFSNIKYLEQLLIVAQKAAVTKFISLGSQAEYGVYNGIIDETEPCRPFQAYGCVKIICSELVRQFCSYHQIDWYWLRLFSFFGKGESENWLIPSLVKKMLTAEEMDLTAGEQKCSYLYVKDMALAIENIICATGPSGIYNISGDKLITLKDLIEKIRNELKPGFQLNFGNLPYRSNQVMHMQGSSAKFIKEFGVFAVSDFDESLSSTIKYLSEDLKECK